MGDLTEHFSQALRVAQFISPAVLGSVTILALMRFVISGEGMQKGIGRLGKVGLAAIAMIRAVMLKRVSWRSPLRSWLEQRGLENMLR